jgi:FAD/FMN-containing dehydrogenase
MAALVVSVAMLFSQVAAGPEGLQLCLQSIPGQPEVIYPDSPLYPTFSNGLRVQHQVAKPAAIILPTTTEQVQAAVICAVNNTARPIPRSGACSFENLGTGTDALVIDLNNMAAVKVDLKSMTAVVQTGIRMGNLYAHLTEVGEAGGRNITCMGGVWPHVGFGGLLAAGGYGSLSRKHGLLADSLLSAKVVDAKGQLLEASPTENPDLFFAIRGGGGGTYGIVVEATIRLYEVPMVTIGVLRYPTLASAAKVLDR